MRLTARRFVAIAALALTTFAATHASDAARLAGGHYEFGISAHTTVQAGGHYEFGTHTGTPVNSVNS